MILFKYQYDNLVHALRNSIQVLESLGRQVEHRAKGIEEALNFTFKQKENLSIISPTGGIIRQDEAGDGHFRAPRGNRVHLGLDFIGVPKQDVFCILPKAKITRTLYPYYDDKFYEGVELVSDNIIAHLMYVIPHYDKIGTMVKRGDVVGIMQDITKKYNKYMKPHIHVNLYINPEILLESA